MAVECTVFNPNLSKKTMNLNNKQKQHLKGLAHPLKPVVMLGNNGLTEGCWLKLNRLWSIMS